MNSHLKAHLQVILATLIIAGSFIATADISDQLHPISLNLMRFSVAALVLAPFVIFKKDNWRKLVSVFPRSLVISFFYCGYFACNFIAMLNTSTLNVGSIYTLTPLITALFSIIFFKQKLTVNSFLVYLLGMIGTLWVVFDGNYELFKQFKLNQGDLVFSLGVLCISGYTISMKLLYRNDDVKVMTFANLAGGVVWMFIAAQFAGISLNWQHLGHQYFPSMAYLAVAATFFTSYLYQKASTVLRPVNISAYIYLSPLCVALLSMALFSESIDVIIWGGIVVSALATLALQYLSKTKAVPNTIALNSHD